MYTEITNLTDKSTGDKYYISTEGNIYLFVKIIHLFRKRKAKKCIQFLNRWR